jgi:two-component system, NarL family, response regulator NreC
MRRAPSPPEPITVLLVDDQAVVRRAIRTLLKQTPGIRVVGEARDGREGVAMALRLDPDVVLMDIGMPVMNGIEATRRIHEVAPRSRILILSSHTDDDYIKAVISMGAVGYILKQSVLSDLARAIRRTGSGGTVVSPLVRRRMNALKPGRVTAPSTARGPAGRPRRAG